MSAVPSRMPIVELQRGAQQIREDLARALLNMDNLLASANYHTDFDRALDALYKELDDIRRDTVIVRHGKSL